MLPLLAAAQETAAIEEDFRAATEAPRLFLRPQRLRLLQREKQRQSLRWMQFDTMISGKLELAEPGFAIALYARVANRMDLCREAGLRAGNDLRQLALVHDWCQLAPLVPKVRQAADAIASKNDLPSVRDRVLAAISIVDAEPKWSEATMRDVIERWWRRDMVAKLRAGAPIPREHTYALLELLHAVRDNLQLDLRDPVQGFFRELPLWHMLSYYPAAYPAAENEYRIPYYQHDGEPDLRIAQFSRAAELSMVAFDSSSIEYQGLQAWVMQDRYIMRGPLGAVYEFLWANPYQPGVTFHFLPNVLHDTRNGRLFIRSNWEEEATFFCYEKGIGQLFEAGKRADVNVAAQEKPVRIGPASVLPAKAPMQFEPGFTLEFQIEQGERRPEEVWFLVGLKPNQKYDIEPDDEEMYEVQADSGGIVSFRFPRPRKHIVRLRETPRR